MTTPSTRARRKPPAVLALLTSFLVVLSGLFVVPAAANAAEATGAAVTNATLDWGVKETWRSYTGGGQLVAPASNSPAPYRWGSSGVGSFDPSTSMGGFAAQGGVIWDTDHFTIGLSNISVAFDLAAGTGALYGDIAGPGPSTTVGAHLANFVFESGNVSVTDGTVSVSNASAVGADGIVALNYEVGEQLDPVSFTFNYEVTAPASESTSVAWISDHSEPVVAGENVTLQVQVTPAVPGTVFFTEGEMSLGSVTPDTATGGASLAVSTLPVGAHSITATFVPEDETAFESSQAGPIVVTIEDAVPAAPIETELTLTSSATSVSDGHQVGLTATMPFTAANRTVVGSIQFYADGAPVGDPVDASVSSNRVTVTFAPTISEGDETEFTAEFTPADVTAYLGSTSNTVTVVGTAPTGPWNPEIEVFVVIDGAEEPYVGQEVYRGEELIVRGNGFDPEANVGGRGVPVPFGPQGTYVVFGNFDSNGWQPSAGYGSSTRKVTNQGWILPESVVDSVPSMYQSAVRNQWVEPTDGSFEWRTGPLTTPETVTDGEFGIYTYAAGGAENARQELSVPVEYIDAERPDSSEEDGDQDDDGQVPGDDSAATGSLLWSFNTGWNNYVKTFAAGTITASQGATQGVDGVIGYPQVEGGDYDPASGLGTIRYQGMVRYVSELHGFDIVLSNPWVVFDDNGVTITAEVSRTDTAGTDTERVTIALLQASEPVMADSVLTWTDVEGTFSADLPPEGWERYIDEAIDPVTFSFGAEAVDPVTPPSVQVSTVKVERGASVTFTGSGFEPGTQVAATVYSTPVALGTKAANADGIVSFDWTVPNNFEIGPHSIELVAGDITVSANFEVVSGAVIVPAAPGAPAQNVCVARAVSGGSMNWGVKESYRTYLQTSPLAKGSFSGGSFGASGGAVNVEAGGIGTVNFAGSVVASGHGGLLQFQLSNPTVQITGPTTGVLIASVNATEPSGAQALASTVVFANLSFPGGVVLSGDTLSVTGASATLTTAGAPGFGGFYGAGTALDPLSFSVSLGGEVPCDSTTDPVELAKTGADSDTGLAIFSIAAMVMMMGAGLLLARRRHASTV